MLTCMIGNMIWMTGNLGTILVSLMLILIVAGVIRTVINDKKNGRSCCGGNCAHCKACAAGRREEKKQ